MQKLVWRYNIYNVMYYDVDHYHEETFCHELAIGLYVNFFPPKCVGPHLPH